MAKSVDILKIDSILEKIGKRGANGKLLVKNRIYRVGVELEGGWAKLVENMQLIRDGSVTVSTYHNAPGQESIDPMTGRPFTIHDNAAYEYFRNEAGNLDERKRTGPRPIKIAVGEFPSEILQVKEYPAWMKKYYPSHVNDSCGMHVHMSMNKALYYSRLMVPEYPQTIIAYMARWAKEEKLDKNHPIWNRLSGKNSYCKLDFFPDEQARQSKKNYDHGSTGHRYTAINYCHGKTATIECRLLPMMDNSELGIKAVGRVLDITNACLVALKAREVKEKTSMVIDNETDEVGETSRVYV